VAIGADKSHGTNQLMGLYAVIDETRQLFHRLRLAAREIHGPGVAATGRGILESLDRHGPTTVPQLARMRPVSRQHIQTHVNALAAEGLVELTANPAHKRSRLVSLTNTGAARIRAMKSLEARLLEQIEMGLGEQELTTTTNVLRTVRNRLESQKWSRLVEALWATQTSPGGKRP